MDYAATVESFEQSGFAVIRNLLDPRIIDTSMDHLESLRSKFGLSFDAPIVAAHPGDPVAASLSGDSRFTALASTALGGAVTCFSVSYLSKSQGPRCLRGGIKTAVPRLGCSRELRR